MMLDYVVRLLVECHARAYPNIDNHNIVKQRAAIKIQLQTCVCTRTKLAASRRKNLTVSWCTMFFSRFACVHCFWQKHLPFFRTRNERFYTQRHINCRIFYLLFVALWMHTRQWMHILHMRVRYSQCAFLIIYIAAAAVLNQSQNVCAWIYLLMLPFFSSLHWCWNQNEAKKMK